MCIHSSIKSFINSSFHLNISESNKQFEGNLTFSSISSPNFFVCPCVKVVHTKMKKDEGKNLPHQKKKLVTVTYQPMVQTSSILWE